jgi:serine/threonine-protein kinase
MAEPNPARPEPFGRYELLELVGEGAMAQVFRARLAGPMGFRKEVAIKRLRTQLLGRDPRQLEALVNEAHTGARLRHARIVEIYEFDHVGDDWYLAMEFVRGWTLDEVLWRLASSDVLLPERAVLDIARQVADALAYAHAVTDEAGRPLNLVHRDLKPQNLFLDRLGTVKIADFGLAKSRANLYHTQEADRTKGSPLYMSPEQVEGRPLDGRSDLFALGTLIVELATFRSPFEGDSVAETLRRVMQADVGSILEEMARSAPRLRPIAARLLQLDRDHRYPHAAALKAELDALARGAPLGQESSALAAALTGRLAQSQCAIPEPVRAPYVTMSAALQRAGSLLADPAPDDSERLPERSVDEPRADLVRKKPDLGWVVALCLFGAALALAAMLVLVLRGPQPNPARGAENASSASDEPRRPGVAGAWVVHTPPPEASPGSEANLVVAILNRGAFAVNCRWRLDGTAADAWNETGLERSGEVWAGSVLLPPDAEGSLLYYFEVRAEASGRGFLKGSPDQPFSVPVY